MMRAKESVAPQDSVSRRELLRVTETDPEYRRRAEAEAQHWEAVHPSSLEALDPIYADGPVDRYRNKRFSGDEKTPWPDLIPRFGPFRDGVMLGTVSIPFETRILEMNPGLHLTFVDLSEGPLARRRNELGSRFPGRVATRVADLNFLVLAPESCDLVVSSSSVHHVTNLEHLAFQIDRGLRPGGYFFLEDYVGEARFTFSDEKKRVYEAVYGRDIARQAGRFAGLRWQDNNDLSPFCGVRSNEILSVFSQWLRPVEVRTTSGLLTPLVRSLPVDWRPIPAESWRAVAPTWRRVFEKIRERYPSILGKRGSHQEFLNPEFLADLFSIGDLLTEAGILLPSNAFAIYRKRNEG